MKVVGYIANIGIKIGASSDVVKELKLEVHGDLADLEALMQEPLEITFEKKQAVFGENLPERHRSKGKKDKPA